MILDKLLRRQPPDQISSGTVQAVYPTTGRVQILGRNGAFFWANYLPQDFPTLAPGQAVAVCTTTGAAFLVRQLPGSQPASVELLEL